MGLLGDIRQRGLEATARFHSATQADIYFHSDITWLSFMACLKSALPVIMSQTDEQGYLDGVIFFCVKSAPNVILQKVLETYSEETHEDDGPIRLQLVPQTNNPAVTKWPGSDSPLQPGNTWSVSENAQQSCQACCFNGLISEAIIVNTSQWTCLQDSGEVAWSQWVMTTKSESRHPSLKNDETLVI